MFYKCYSAANWDGFEVKAPATSFQPSDPRWSSGPLSCQLSRFLWSERMEDIDGGQVSAVTAPSIRAHRDVLLPHLQLCSGRFCRGTASIVNVVWCFSASAESLVTQSIAESGVQPICNALVSSPSAAVAATEVAAPVVRVLLGVRRLQFQLRLLIRRPVSKSHLLQFRERLHLLSASREFPYVLLCYWCPWQLRPVLFPAGFALRSNIIAICSNTTVCVGVTIFAFCWSALRLPGSCQPLESESLIEVASGTFVSRV